MSSCSEKAINFLGFAVNIDVVKARARRETGHRGNCTHERIQESGAHRRPDVTNRKRESSRGTLNLSFNQGEKWRVVRAGSPARGEKTSQGVWEVAPLSQKTL